MFRCNTYTEGNMQVAVPLARQQVVPGQSVNLSVSTMFETPPFNRQILTGGRVSLYAFYVPFRLVWGSWVNFVAQVDGYAAVPTGNVPWDAMFERGAVSKPVTVFGRRAYKLIYNQFFGWRKNLYGTPTGDWSSEDDVTTFKPVRGMNQLLGHLVESDRMVDETMEVPVVNDEASIPLNALRQNLRNAYSNQTAKMTGDKYVDAISRMGVTLDWRVQNAPEFLGAVHKDIWPKRTRVTTTQDAGKPVAYYSETMQLNTGRRFFAEHGIIWVVGTFRPQLWAVDSATAAPIEECVEARVKDRGSVWLGDNQTGVTTVKDDYFSSDTTAQYSSMPRMGYLKWGQNLVGQQSLGTDPLAGGSPWYNRCSPADINNAIYPQSLFDPEPERGYQVVWATQYADKGVSPVKLTT